MCTIVHEGRLLALVLAALYLSGCGEKPIVTTYDIPKEYEKAALIWATPTGWVKDEDSPGPKGASFLIEGKGGLVGKVAAMSFGAEVTMLDVANMFGRELGLGFLTVEELSAISEKKKLGGHEFEIARLGGDDNSTLEQRSATIALLPGKNETWLLMMIAAPSLANEQRPRFEQFLGSLTVFASKEDPAEIDLDSFLHPPVDTELSPPFAPPPAPVIPKPEWKVPEDWEEQPVAGPRVASFAVKGEGDAALDVSVTRFPGSMGGASANLNRWRGQLGLESIDVPIDLLEYVDEREVDGRPAHVVELANGKRGMLAVMILSEEGSWFVKALGDAALAKSQKANFEAFLDSIRFAAP
jgi:hypothetical protein